MPVARAAALKADAGPLAIIAGGGSLPGAVADAVIKRGRDVVMFPVREWAEPARVEKYPHHWLSLIQAGRFLRYAREAGCRDVVFIGSAFRPPFWSFRLDWVTLRLLPRIAFGYRGGDDHLISSAARIFEDYGFRIVAAHEVAPEILMPEGALGRLAPSERDQADIARALALLAAIGPFDIGQGAVVAANNVLAIEAADGTDAMLEHVAKLRERGRVSTAPGTGVLVKAPKPQQDRRFDLPAIGPRTVEGVARAGLAGIAVVAGEAIIADAAAVAAAADHAGVFVVGIASSLPR